MPGIMGNRFWTLFLGIALVALSIVLYFIHFSIFQDPHHIGIYFLGDLAFVPIEVLLVTLVIHRLLDRQDKQRRMEKMNMVIGAFFSGVGGWLLTYLSDRDPALGDLRTQLILSDQWTEDDFRKVALNLQQHPCDIDRSTLDLALLKTNLGSRRDFLLRLLENPTLLEHEKFTELLRAVFHFTEELDKRPQIPTLPESDVIHLVGDAKRVYRLLIPQWLEYMQYLKKNYPYLFSLAMRTNPFDESASPIIS
jgi:hypothetical protein